MTYCRAELLDESYFHAVFEGIKGVADRVPGLSGLTGDGAHLVTQAFMGPEPKLMLGSLVTDSAKS